MQLWLPCDSRASAYWITAEDHQRTTCLRTCRLLYHPPLLPFTAPPQVRRLCRWSRLHSVWRRGSRCPACLAGSRAQLDSATRFNLPGDLPSSMAFSRCRWQSRNAPVLREEIAVLLAKDAIEPVPPAKKRQGFYSPYFIVPKKGGGLRPILDLPYTSSRSRCWRTSAWSNASSPRIGLQRSTWRSLTFTFRSFRNTDPRWVWRRGTLRVGITQQCRRSLSPWTDLAFLRAGVPLEQMSRHTVVTTDASSTGWGATCNG